MWHFLCSFCCGCNFLKVKNVKEILVCLLIFRALQCSVVSTFLRQDAGDGEALGHQVGQVAVHEDKQGLDGAHVVGETCGESSREAKQEAEEDASGCHHKEAGDSQEDVGGLHDGHVCQEGEHVVQHLKTVHSSIIPQQHRIKEAVLPNNP